MNRIYVDISGDDYPSCPLRSDLNSCNGCEHDKRNTINCCPHLDEDDKYIAPEWCPIRNGGVEIMPK